MSGETATDATTFAELLNGSGPSGSSCRRCGEPATHRAQLIVRPRVKREGGGRGGATPAAVASHKSDLCERCAVQLFAQVKKAMR